MKLNIANEYVSLEDFLSLLSSTSNIKDVHLLAHQAGCPVYIVRDTNNKCGILWHLCKETERNTHNIIVTDGVLNIHVNGTILPFIDLDDLKKSDVTFKYMLYGNPFDPEFLVWSNDMDWEVKDYRG